eukprot:g19407.t1
MGNMHLMYAHQSSLTFRLECLTPPDVWAAACDDETFKVPVYHEPSGTVVFIPLRDLMANGVVYNGRGWCIAEKEWSAARSVLGQNMVMDGEADDESGDQETKKVPTAPDGFIRQMETSNFTHRNDQKDVVHLQEKIFYEKVTARKYLKLSDLTQAHLVELTGSLPHYQNLQVLKIELFTGEKEQVIAFVQALSTLPLQKLLLKNLRGPEGIGNVLAEALAAILTDHRSLTEVDLSYCEVSNVGAKALAKALQRNTTLTDLRFYGCEIDDFGVEARVLQLSIFH